MQFFDQSVRMRRLFFSTKQLLFLIAMIVGLGFSSNSTFAASCAGVCRPATQGCTDPEKPASGDCSSSSWICCQDPGTTPSTDPGNGGPATGPGNGGPVTGPGNGGPSTDPGNGGPSAPSTPSTGSSSQQVGAPLVFANPLAFSDINSLVTALLLSLQKFIVILALIFILIGAFFYITSAGDDSRMETGKKAILASLIGLALGIAAPAFLKEIASILGWGNPTLPQGVGTSLSLLEIAENVLSFLLTIIGILAIIMLVVGGTFYLTAAGDEDRIDKGKKIITYSLIGILIALGSLVLVRQVAGFFG